jgi:hypothetical protein
VDLVLVEGRLIIYFRSEDELHEYFKITDKKKEATRDSTYEMMTSGDV